MAPQPQADASMMHRDWDVSLLRVFAPLNTAYSILASAGATARQFLEKHLKHCRS